MKRMIACLTASLLLDAAAIAGTYTWDDSSADHQWANPLNWTADDGIPGAGDDASFTDSVPSIVILQENQAARNLTFNHYSNTVAVELQDSAELAVTNLNVGNGDLSNATSLVTMTGGMLRANGTITVGGHAGAYYSITYGALTLSNTVLDLSQASTIRVGWNSQSSGSYGSVSGLCNLAAAILTANTTNNLFKLGTSLTIGGVGAGAGILALPPTVQEIDIPSVTFGSAVQASRSPYPWSVLDLGDDPQLRRVVFRDYVRFGKMMTLYRENGTSMSNRWPANIEFTIGLPNAPITLSLGDVSQTEASIAWKEMKGFESHITDLVIGNNTGSSSGDSRGELSLAATNTVSLIGSITATSVDLPGRMSVGGGTRTSSGILRLPQTVTNITVGSFTLGAYYNSNPDDALSMIDLGDNPQLTAMTATNDFTVGHGIFLYADNGASRTGIPAGVALSVGLSPEVRATFKYAHMQRAYTVDVGPSISRFSAYLREFRIGNLAGGIGSRIAIGRLDLRHAVMGPFDVDGHFIIAATNSNRGYVYLPPGEVIVSSNLLMGLGFSTVYPSTALLSLSNTVFRVGGIVRLGTNTTVQCALAGSPCGLDFEVGTNAVFEAGNSRIDLAFLTDPGNPASPYWGIKLRNTNAVALLQSWTTAPARVTFDTSGLSPKARELFGIHYDTGGNFTYLGVLKRPRQSVIQIR